MKTFSPPPPARTLDAAPQFGFAQAEQSTAEADKEAADRWIAAQNALYEEARAQRALEQNAPHPPTRAPLKAVRQEGKLKNEILKFSKS